MNALFDVGYTDFKNPELLLSAVRQSSALLLDVRYSPRSRTPTWNNGILKALLGEQYSWCNYLGNINYKGGPLKIVDLEAGLTRVLDQLKTRPVILMCGCWNRQECHRYHITQVLQERYGIVSTWLTQSIARELAGTSAPPVPPAQFPLF